MKIRIFLILIGVLSLPFSAQCADIKGGNAPVVREHILVRLQQAQEHIDNKSYATSREILLDLQDGRLSEYERSQVLQMQAFQAYHSNQPEKAIGYYQNILQLSGLPDFTIEQTLYSLGQLYFSIDKFKAANESLNRWFSRVESPNLDAYELHALVLYQLKQYNRVVVKLDIAIELSSQQKKAPRENWLQLLNSVYYDRQEYQSSIAIVRQLLIHYPKKAYWIQLAGLHGELGQKRQQLSVLDAAYTRNLLSTENELKTLAYLYIELKAPYKAAKVLQQAFERDKLPRSEKNLRLLANAWRMAKEIGHSINALEQAAANADHGNIYAELAQLYLIDQQYQKAVNASRNALEKGELKTPGRVYTTLAVAQLKQQRFDQADQALAKARVYPSQLKLVSLWERHLKQLRQLKTVN
jgi:hypothetical protein